MLTVSVQWMYLKGRSRSKRAGWLGPSRQNQVIPNDPKWWFGTGPTTNPTTLNASITPSLYKEGQQLSPALCSFSRNLSLHTFLFSRYFFTSFVLTHTLSAFVHKIEHTVFLILVCFSGKFFSTSFFFRFVLHSLWSFASKVSVSLRSNNSCYKEVIFHIYDFFLKNFI